MFTKLSLSNILKHGESDVERQIIIQCMHLTVFFNYVWKREGSFNTISGVCSDKPTLSMHANNYAHVCFLWKVHRQTLAHSYENDTILLFPHLIWLYIIVDARSHDKG